MKKITFIGAGSTIFMKNVIGGYKPCTVTDFEILKKYGLEQIIGDSLGIGGIMRGLRTVPHLWKLCDHMR